PDRRGCGGRSGERRRELAADQPDRLEVGVEEMLEHHPVAAGALVGAETLGGLFDGADDGEGLDSGEPVVERGVAWPSRVERARTLERVVACLADDAARHDREAQRPRLLPDRRGVLGRDERRVVLVGEPERGLDGAPPAAAADEQRRPWLLNRLRLSGSVLQR